MMLLQVLWCDGLVAEREGWVGREGHYNAAKPTYMHLLYFLQFSVWQLRRGFTCIAGLMKWGTVAQQIKQRQKCERRRDTHHHPSAVRGCEPINGIIKAGVSLQRLLNQGFIETQRPQKGAFAAQT